MARPRTYDQTEAIAGACRAFWQHGYSALGVRALEKLTGLNKFAIRTEFGGKEGLYLAALEFYHSAARDSVLAPMRTGGVETIAQFFQKLVTKGSVNSSAWGCLMVNTGIENAEIQSPALQQAAEAYWTELHSLFRLALLRSQAAGVINQSLQINEASRGLVTAVMGIHTMNRVSAAHDAGRHLVDMVQELLTSWEARDANSTF